MKFLIKISFLLLGVASLFPARAEKPYTLKDLDNPGPRRGVCQRLIASIEQDFDLDGLDDEEIDRITYSIEHIHDIDKMLIQANIPPAEVQNVDRLYRNLLDLKKAGPLRELVFKLRKRQYNERLFVCMVTGCNLINDLASYQSILPGFEVVESFEGVKPRHFPVELHPKAVRSLVDAIVVTYPNLAQGRRRPVALEYRPLIFVASIAHEYQHFFDQQLIYRWITANRLLIANHRTPDELFREYVAWDADDEGLGANILVKADFYYALMESRATRSQYYFSKRHLTDEEIERMDGNLALNAFDYIEEKGGGKLLDSFGVTREKVTDVYDLANSWVARMQRTINEAKPFVPRKKK